MEIKTTHEIWKEHYHNENKLEGDIPCNVKWVRADEVIERLNKTVTYQMRQEFIKELQNSSLIEGKQ